MNDEQAISLRAEQDRLLGLLRRRTTRGWTCKLWTAGPSPLDLENGLYPKFREKIVALADTLEKYAKDKEERQKEAAGGSG